MRWFVITLLLAGALHAQTFSDPDFTVDWLATPGYGTIALDFDATGRLYVGQKRGIIHLLTPNAAGGYDMQATPFADLTSFIYTSSESGLLGMALDPDFTTNRYMYLFYSTPSDQRLVRIQADATFTAWTTTQTILLSGLPRNAGNHNAGDIDFHPNDPDSIYIVLGDDANISLADNLDYYHGKILKVNKSDGFGLTTNPHYVPAQGTDSVRARIWAIGFRNPFRFCFHPNPPVPETMYISENGGPSGVSLQDRLCFTQRGCDGFWNTANASAGTNSPYYSPINPAGSECKVLWREQSSHIGVEIVQGGPFGDPANPNDSVIYLSNWLQQGGSIRRWRLTGANLDAITPIAADSGGRFVTGLYATDMKFGPDGHMYFTQSGNGLSTGTSYHIGRIRYLGNQPPVASFTTSPTPATGPTPLSVQFTDTSSDLDGSIVAWAWDFGDGNNSTLQNPQHSYTAPGQYTVTLTVTDNDNDTDDAQATVNATVPVPPVASFTTNPSPATGKVPFSVQFNDTSTDSDGSIVGWLWDFGDGNSSTQQHPSHTYTVAGSYTATLTVTDSSALQDDAQAPVNVVLTDPPVASFTTSPSPAQGLAPLTVQFTDTSTDSDGTIVAWLWAFGDGNTSTQQNPLHTYTAAGSFTATLTATDDDALQNSTNVNVQVFAPTPPIASFTAMPAGLSGSAPLFVQFTDSSSDADGSIVTWAWDFGDGNTSSAQHTSHFYSTPGVFTATLTVTDNHGLQDSDLVTVTVTSAPADTGDGDDNSGCALAPAGPVALLALLVGAAILRRRSRQRHGKG